MYAYYLSFELYESKKPNNSRSNARCIDDVICQMDKKVADAHRCFIPFPYNTLLVYSMHRSNPYHGFQAMSFLSLLL